MPSNSISEPTRSNYNFIGWKLNGNYVTKINELTNIILAKNNNAKFIYIAPFISLENDTNTLLKHEDKIALISEYSNKLKTYTDNNNHIFIDINTALNDTFNKYIVSKYMLDALKTIKEEDILILLNSDIKPIIIKSVKDESLIQLILPIKTY